MKFEIEHTDARLIAEYIFDLMRPNLPPVCDKKDSAIMSVQELSDYLKVDPSWVYKQIQFKSIPHFHAGKYPRFKKQDIDVWIQENSTPPTKAPYPKLSSR